MVYLSLGEKGGTFYLATNPKLQLRVTVYVICRFDHKYTTFGVGTDRCRLFQRRTVKNNMGLKRKTLGQKSNY